MSVLINNLIGSNQTGTIFLNLKMIELSYLSESSVTR